MSLADVAVAAAALAGAAHLLVTLYQQFNQDRYVLPDDQEHDDHP